MTEPVYPTDLELRGSDAQPQNSAYAWYVVALLYCAAIVSYLDRQIIALMAEDIRLDLALNDLQIGLLQGPPFGVFYALMSLPIAVAADRGSRRNLIAAGVLFWSLATVACGLTSRFWHLFIARVGIGEATLTPAGYSLIGDYFRKDRAPLALAVFSMGNLTGIGIALLLGGLLINSLAELGSISLPVIGALKPWQLTFVIVGLPGVLLAAAMLTVSEPARRTNAGDHGGLREFGAFFKQKRRVFLSLFISFMLLTILAYANFSWVVVYFIRTFNWTAGEAGVGFGFVILVFGTSGGLFGGYLASVLTRRGYKDATFRAALCCTLPVAPIAVATFMLAPTGEWALAGFCVTQFFGSTPVSLAGASILTITPNRMRAKTSSVYLFFTNIFGMSLGPTSVGFLTTVYFADPGRINVALAMVNGVMAPIAVIVLALAMKPYRDAVITYEQLHPDEP